MCVFETLGDCSETLLSASIMVICSSLIGSASGRDEASGICMGIWNVMEISSLSIITSLILNMVDR